MLATQQNRLNVSVTNIFSPFRWLQFNLRIHFNNDYNLLGARCNGSPMIMIEGLWSEHVRRSTKLTTTELPHGMHKSSYFLIVHVCTHKLSTFRRSNQVNSHPIRRWVLRPSDHCQVHIHGYKEIKGLLTIVSFEDYAFYNPHFWMINDNNKQGSSTGLKSRSLYCINVTFYTALASQLNRAPNTHILPKFYGYFPFTRRRIRPACQTSVNNRKFLSFTLFVTKGSAIINLLRRRERHQLNKVDQQT